MPQKLRGGGGAGSDLVLKIPKLKLHFFFRSVPNKLGSERLISTVQVGRCKEDLEVVGREGTVHLQPHHTLRRLPLHCMKRYCTHYTQYTIHYAGI